MLGDDGGALCDDPGERPAHRRSLNAQLTNGAAGPGHAADHRRQTRLLQGQLLVIEVYCPDELEDFQEFVDDLKTDDVTES